MEPTETASSPRPVFDRLLPGPGVLLSRGVLYVVLLLLGAAGIWAAVVRVDVVVQARGRLVVDGEPVPITAPEPGMVIEVAVKVGARVRKDDVLLRLDPLKHASEATQIASQLKALRGEAARHRQSAGATREVLRSVREERALTAQGIEIIVGQVKSLKDLVEKGAVPSLQLEQKGQELIEARARVARLDAELKRGDNEARDLERQADEAEARAEGLAAKLAALRESERQMTLLAPTSGTVTQMGVVHPGSVLGTAEPAVVIMPDDRVLRATLKIPNASMRRPQPGMKVKMRFDAYPYQDFGHVEGELLRIDPDADAEGAYRAWVALERLEIHGPRGEEALRAGLMFDADIIVDRRRLIEFALQPFRRLGEPLSVTE